jgi:hypothetical protein
LNDPVALDARRGDRSDTFFKHLTETGTLQKLLLDLLPGRSLALPLSGVNNHDDRAALVCALTALAVAAGDYTAVGDANGWIVLPPRRFIDDWAWDDLEANDRDGQSAWLYQTPSQRSASWAT